MNLFARLKNLFTSDRLPSEGRKAYAQARDLDGLVTHLGDLTTRNEVILRQIRAATSKLEATDRATVMSIKRGNISGRGVRLALQTINRYRKQLDTLDRKADIVNKNLNLHLNLIGKIEVMQAMSMRGVEPELIDQIILDFTENVEKYQEAAVGSDAIVSPDQSMLSETERKELETLEQEVLGEVKYFAKGRVKTADQPEVDEEEKEGVDFEPLPTEDDVRNALDESERVLKELEQNQGKPELEME